MHWVESVEWDLAGLLSVRPLKHVTEHDANTEKTQTAAPENRHEKSLEM